jgi:Raf kinase inhibitor-like YbhB/YbcL family protein
MVQWTMKRRFTAFGFAALAAIASACGPPQAKLDLQSKTNSALTVTAAEFAPGQVIPGKNTAKGANLSPTISWTTVPGKTKSVTVIVDDPDANGFVHWVIYNISAETNKLPAGLPGTAQLNALGSVNQGKNGTGSLGYFGPKPPPGKPHHYHFRVYALDVLLPLKPAASAAEVQRAMSGHILAQGDLVGIYQSH